VTKCWNHAESEKLLCEEIDVGESTVRNIASGIRAFYSAEELQGRLVMVLCNLKERAIAGFKSQVTSPSLVLLFIFLTHQLPYFRPLHQGMVLCASNADHSAVKLLEPPADAKVGDKVAFPGFEGEVATPAQMAKKKILEGLLPEVRAALLSPFVACSFTSSRTNTASH
jgi:tRNA-binding EMAP/Myf-like protein